MFQKSNWKTRILIIGYMLDVVGQCDIVEVKPFHGAFYPFYVNQGCCSPSPLSFWRDAVAGRPSDYKAEYCEMLVEHMAEGLSFESFAGLVGCALSTLYEWEKKNPAFSEAKKEGFERNRLFYERVGLRMMEDGQGSATVWLFNMKNRFPKQWRDKQEIDNTHTLNGEAKVQLYIPDNGRSKDSE